eukprot:CAMPEP_0181452856 /NCGR_PEP_ID=MMETSP1110-20121109/29425_1 /TAXON_ID=174948 /ORGANISM="Symbiodinium sp., Strain CCMP421" /LENGTH=498 /DNA_ID=CAMNT_0023577157 /DNA_START=93 /DNA_END=1586 /DNA_ORIENTATION=-
MGGQQSAEAQEPAKDGRVEEVPKAEEPQQAQSQPAEEPQKAESKKSEAVKAEEKPTTSEGKKDTKAAEGKKATASANSPPAGPLQPGAQPKGKAAPKPAAKTSAKAGAPKKKPQQPGPPQQPGLITPEAQAAAPKKAAKGEKGKGGGKKGQGTFPGIQLCVRNLVKDATTEQLQNLFQPFGELIGVDVKKNTDGTCRGYGFVTYTSIADANKAISAMNNKQVEGKNLIVVLSDRQQGTTKAEREAQATGGKGAKGKDGKEGKGGDKGKGKSKQPANIANALPAANPPWPYQGEGTYPYGYGYPVVSPMAAYANQGYAPNTQQAALQAMQAQFITQAQQALQMQAFHSSLGGLNPGINPNMPAPVSNVGANNMQPNAAAPAPAPPPTASAAAPSDEAQALKQEHEGQLKSISAKNGYGFIACNETKVHYKRDVFVDSSLLPEGIQVNDKVIFSLTLSEKGHPRATSVRQVGQVAAAEGMLHHAVLEVWADWERCKRFLA